MYVIVQGTGFCDYFVNAHGDFDYALRYAARWETSAEAHRVKARLEAALRHTLGYGPSPIPLEVRYIGGLVRQ